MGIPLLNSFKKKNTISFDKSNLQYFSPAMVLIGYFTVRDLVSNCTLK